MQLGLWRAYMESMFTFSLLEVFFLSKRILKNMAFYCDTRGRHPALRKRSIITRVYVLICV